MTPPRDGRFESIYRERYARVWRYFRAARVSDDESHDLAQDAFVRFYEYMDDMRNPDDEWPFLQSIARTILLNRIRYWHTQRRAAKMVDIDADDSYDIAASDMPDYEATIDLKRRIDALHKAMTQLSGTQRDAMLLRLQEFTYEEIAGALRISVDAVRSRLRDARRFLRTRLGSEIELPEDEQ